MTNKVDLNWAMGFIEGEGCFGILLKERTLKNGLRLLKVTCTISVSIVEKDKRAVYFLKRLFKGNIQKRKKEYWENKNFPNVQDQIQWRICNMEDCKNFSKIIKNYKFKTSKGNKYKLWNKVVTLIDKKEHLTKEGILKILELREKMNEKIKSKNSKNISYY